MSDTQTTEVKNPNTNKKPSRQKMEPLEVTRCGVSAPFVDREITKKGSKSLGWIYLGPDINKDNVMDWVNWIGPADLAKKLLGPLNQLAQGWWEEAEKVATDEATKITDQVKQREVFSKLAEEFSGRGEPIPKMIEKKMELADDLVNADIDQFESVEKYSAYIDEIKAEIRRINDDIKGARRAPKGKQEQESDNGVTEGQEAVTA